ncbi:MAG: hypothetical protein HZC42_15410 [Candidatus Eisenbacteria bacterium]|nr:hypothetical protein [Candidatus Eisenbacteria bacterium]
MRIPLALMVLLVGTVVPAAGATAAGVNFSWDACASEGGVQSKTFACNTNAGSRAAWGSFIVAAAQDSFVGVEIIVAVQAQSDTLPDWWQFFNSGACRQTALSTSFDFTSAPGASCTDPWFGQAAGGLAAYHTINTVPPVPSGLPNAARIKIGAAVPSTSPLTLAAGTEYYCFRLILTNAKTAGSGACSGCDIPVCLTLSEIKVAQLNGAVEDLTQPISQNVVYWQSSGGSCGATAPQNVIWGQIRSILR